MKRRSFLVSSAVSAVSCALPVSLSLLTTPSVSAVVTQGVGESLPAQPFTHEALFKLHNWEADPEHHTPNNDTATIISLSATWKATWL
jgi:hypothetical protein